MIVGCLSSHRIASNSHPFSCILDTITTWLGSEISRHVHVIASPHCGSKQRLLITTMVERLYLAGAPAYNNIEAGSAEEAAMQGKSFEARFLSATLVLAIMQSPCNVAQRHIFSIRRAVPIVSSTAIDAYIPVCFRCETWKQCHTVTSVQAHKDSSLEASKNDTVLPVSAHRQPAIYKVKIGPRLDRLSLSRQIPTTTELDSISFRPLSSIWPLCHRHAMFGAASIYTTDLFTLCHFELVLWYSCITSGISEG